MSNTAASPTPGPWFPVDTPKGYIIRPRNDIEPVVIAELRDRRSAQGAADAKLIASAPDILAALRLALERLRLNNCDGSEAEYIAAVERAVYQATGG